MRIRESLENCSGEGTNDVLTPNLYWIQDGVIMRSRITEIYRFKVALKGRRRIWRRIEIRGDQTLADLDRIIRIAFNHDLWDHLGEFYSGKTWYRSGYGEINPDGEGEGAKIPVASIGLQEGDRIGYVYDFGSEIHHYVTLESISKNADPAARYPLIVSQNHPTYKYCVKCAASGKKNVATQICLDCSSEHRSEPEYLCEDCGYADKHEEHFLEEIVY